MRFLQEGKINATNKRMRALNEIELYTRTAMVDHAGPCSTILATHVRQPQFIPGFPQSLSASSISSLFKDPLFIVRLSSPRRSHACECRIILQPCPACIARSSTISTCSCLRRHRRLRIDNRYCSVPRQLINKSRTGFIRTRPITVARLY
jgi:hypothetical protein